MNEENVQFYTGFNYEKKYLQDSQTDSIPDSGFGTPTVISIPHNLQKITRIRVWYKPGTSNKFPISTEQFSDDVDFTSEVNSVTAKVYLTTTNLVIEYLNASGVTQSVTTYYRIYYDD